MLRNCKLQVLFYTLGNCKLGLPIDDSVPSPTLKYKQGNNIYVLISHKGFEMPLSDSLQE